MFSTSHVKQKRGIALPDFKKEKILGVGQELESIGINNVLHFFLKKRPYSLFLLSLTNAINFSLYIILLRSQSVVPFILWSREVY